MFAADDGGVGVVNVVGVAVTVAAAGDIAVELYAAAAAAVVVSYIVETG